jgi:alpha-amylase
MGVLLEGFFFGSTIGQSESWWDHLARQSRELSRSGFTAIWLPPPLKGSSGGFSNGYDPFDDYDLGSKNQKGTVATRYGSREALQRCVAVMRANGIDVYVDLVENQRDGDDGHFKFQYNDAFGKSGGGRFPKGPSDFHPFVPQDPGVFSDQFTFGRDLAPINGGSPRGACGEQLIAAAEWLTRALDVQGYRLDDVKGVSTVFLNRLLSSGAMAGKFAVGEFADGNVGLLNAWADAVLHRAACFDFPLHFLLKSMCNEPDGFSMASLDRAGLVGRDPLGAVTFVENHDTDRGGVGGPVVRNKLLAYAYILTAEGYPCVFYRDYSTDPQCFGLKRSIDRLISIHERVATGSTQQRFMDGGVYAFERLGASHLLVALNKDVSASRTITVHTGFGANRELQNLTDDGAPRVKTTGRSEVTFTVPKNAGGAGYVCYGIPTAIGAPFARTPVSTTQVYEGAEDLDIQPAVEGETIKVCRVFPEAHSVVRLKVEFDTAEWSEATTVRVSVRDSLGAELASAVVHRDTPQALLSARPLQTGFHGLVVVATNTPPQSRAPRYSASVTYLAPREL